MKSVLNTQGEDITRAIVDAARSQGLDPVHLLALLEAESGLNPRAERWGNGTAEAKTILARGDWPVLQLLINNVWPDISFGMSQRIVLFHDFGDRTQSVDNVLAVRAWVFANPEDDILQAARRLQSTTWHSSYDGTILSSLVIYNAGSDRRDDPDWLATWAGNVASYEAALAWAETYRDEGDAMDKAEIQRSLGVVWGIAELLGALKSGYAQELKDAVVSIKKEVGLQA